MVEADHPAIRNDQPSGLVAGELSAAALARRARALTGAAAVLVRRGGWLMAMGSDGDGGVGPLALADPALARLAPLRALSERRIVAGEGEPTALWTLLARPHIAYPLLTGGEVLGVLVTAPGEGAAARAAVEDLAVLGAAALRAGTTPDERPARVLTQVATAAAMRAGGLDEVARAVADAFGARGAALLLPDPTHRLAVAGSAGLRPDEATWLAADDARWVLMHGQPRLAMLGAAGRPGSVRLARLIAACQVLFVPLPVGNRAAGVLALLEPAAERAHDAAEVALAQAAGALLAMAVVVARADDALHLGDGRLRALIEASRDSILIVDEHQIIRHLSPAARLSLQLSSEAVGLPLATALRAVVISRGDGQPATLDALPLLGALRSGEPVTAELRLQAAGGARHHYRCRAEALRDTTGRVVGAVTVDRDVTDERRQERLMDALAVLVGASSADPAPLARCAVEQVVATLELDIAALWLVDPTRQELRWEAAQGLPADHPELTTMPLAAPSLVAEAARTATLQLVEETPTAEVANAAWRRASGCPADVAAALFVPLVVRAAPVGVLVLLSRQPRHFDDAELEVAQVLAAFLAMLLDGMSLAARTEALHRQDDFVSLVSHELKTPLTSIKGYAELIARRLARDGHDPRHLQALAVIAQQAHRMGALVNDLLDLSRHEAGRLTMTVMPHDLGPLVERVVMRCREATAHPIRWERPAQPAPVLVDGDRIEQVVAHLLSNAVRHSPEAGAITVWLHQENHEAVVSVTDTGPGIAPEQRARLFERSPWPTTTPGAGLGIGLFISRQIALAHGGRLWVTSTPGQGSTFALALPLTRKA